MEFILKNPILVFIIAINLVAAFVCIADKIKAAPIYSEVMGSDHCPVVLEIK